MESDLEQLFGCELTIRQFLCKPKRRNLRGYSLEIMTIKMAKHQTRARLHQSLQNRKAFLYVRMGSNEV